MYDMNNDKQRVNTLSDILYISQTRKELQGKDCQ